MNITLNFPENRLDDFLAVVEKIQKKISKIDGLDKLNVLKTERYDYIRQYENYFGQTVEEKIPFLKAEVESPFGNVLKKQGFEFLATISKESLADSTWQIYNPSKDSRIVGIANDISDKNGGKIVCDHCGTSRKRSGYHIFKKKMLRRKSV